MISPRAYGRVTHLPKTYCPNPLLSDHPVDELGRSDPPLNWVWHQLGQWPSVSGELPPRAVCLLTTDGELSCGHCLEDQKTGMKARALITQEPAFQGGQAEAALKDLGLHCVLAAPWWQGLPRVRVSSELYSAQYHGMCYIVGRQ